MAVEGTVGCFYQAGMIAKSEVVVGAEIQNGPAGARQVDGGRLGGADDAFCLESSW